MLLEAYFDDSSDSKRQRFCAIGGLFGNPAQWGVFDDQWGVVTSSLSGPSHATDCDCNPPRGVFRGWTKEECDGLMKALIKIIRSCHLAGFGSVVPVPEYRTVFPGYAEYDPYFLALKHAIINMATLGAMVAPSFGSGGIQFWCEDGGTSVEAHRIYRCLKSVKTRSDRKYLTGSSTADKRLMALQGADLTGC